MDEHREGESLGDILGAQERDQPAILWGNIPRMIGFLIVAAITFWVVKNTVGPALDWAWTSVIG